MSFVFTPPEGYRNQISFPTAPGSETEFRNSMQSLLDQLRDELNKPTSSAAAFAQYNKLINGGLYINQRVVTGAVTLSPGQYGHDRWKAGAGGCTYTFATTNNDTVITIVSGSLIQVIEGIILVSGTYTLSWIGTAQGKIGGGPYGASGISAIIVGGANLNVEFNAGTLNKVRFNPGDQQLPFQLRMFGEELALCQRYYEKSYDIGTAPGTVTSAGYASIGSCSDNQNILLNLRFKTVKRVAPIMTFYHSDGTTSALGEGAGNAKRIITSAGNNGQSAVGFAQIGALGLTAGNPVYGHWTSEAEL